MYAVISIYANRINTIHIYGKNTGRWDQLELIWVISHILFVYVAARYATILISSISLCKISIVIENLLRHAWGSYWFQIGLRKKCLWLYNHSRSFSLCITLTDYTLIRIKHLSTCSPVIAKSLSFVMFKLLLLRWVAVGCPIMLQRPFGFQWNPNKTPL